VNNSPYERPDPRAAAIRELVAAEYQQVLDAVQERWGKNDLFAALYVSPEAKGDLYPLRHGPARPSLHHGATDQHGTRVGVVGGRRRLVAYRSLHRCADGSDSTAHPKLPKMGSARTVSLLVGSLPSFPS
jgi:hypothetical protein